MTVQVPVSLYTKVLVSVKKTVLPVATQRFKYLVILEKGTLVLSGALNTNIEELAAETNSKVAETVDEHLKLVGLV